MLIREFSIFPPNSDQEMRFIDILSEFVVWAFQRHQNILSWYIRPLFLLPFCYFSYQRNIKGLILTLIALATSMFWFPEPEMVNPKVKAFLEMERDYLFGEWNLMKVALSSLVPVTMFALAYAFWKHSWKYGLLVINLIAMLKVFWSLYAGEEGSGITVVLPALTGVTICNLAIWIVYRLMRRK